MKAKHKFMCIYESEKKIKQENINKKAEQNR